MYGLTEDTDFMESVVIPSYVVLHCFEIKESEDERGRGTTILGGNRMNG
jgi:hypothetical protein